ncbi:MAG: hypothetical protein QME44_09935, partial [Thermodesulfobacteriota bacterium]|nr:hypothetical protein [Thermodesulfobacteriota bacterium]
KGCLCRIKLTCSIAGVIIMRAFMRLRQMISSHKDLLRKVEEMEKKYDEQFQVVFEAIKQLMAPPEKPKRKIGF